MFIRFVLTSSLHIWPLLCDFHNTVIFHKSVIFSSDMSGGGKVPSICNTTLQETHWSTLCVCPFAPTHTQTTDILSQCWLCILWGGNSWVKMPRHLVAAPTQWATFRRSSDNVSDLNLCPEPAEYDLTARLWGCVVPTVTVPTSPPVCWVHHLAEQTWLRKWPNRNTSVQPETEMQGSR